MIQGTLHVLRIKYSLMWGKLIIPGHGLLYNGSPLPVNLTTQREWVWHMRKWKKKCFAKKYPTTKTEQPFLKFQNEINSNKYRCLVIHEVLSISWIFHIFCIFLLWMCLIHLLFIAHFLAPKVWSLGREDLLEEEMATCSSILAWRIPWTEEHGGLQSMGSKELYTTEHTCTDTLLQWSLDQKKWRLEPWRMNEEWMAQW